ncbi:Hypothetical protein, putative [Bodo saltans]|uniref:Uncharacterized protein n=1 Tax=Bodo saltans TaxID=75058 RepID=A0A0S4JUC2_BODSA|nr:Hypothetical protein, putative [Bodo saltans]|eukprot:CUG93887.1 Hypothetical protein, putative [Bodo saltans]
MGGQQKQRVSSRVAHFQSLVLHFSDSSRNNASSFVALRLVAPFCAQCQEFIDRCPGAIVRFVVPMGGVPIVSFPVEDSFQNDSALRSTTPILVSMSIHKSIPQFIAQLENIATYIGRARCVIIVHVSPLWRFTEMEWAALRSANASNRYPSVYINPHSYHLSFSMLFSVQLLNAKYVVDALPWVHFSHVLCVASNEVFLRKRVADFIQLYDVSTCSSNTKHDSIRSFHAYPGGEAINSFRAVKGDASEELGSRLWPGKLPPYGLRGSLKASMGPALKKVVVPIAQSFTEGSYFRKDVALALSNELQRLFPLEEAHLNKPISSKLESLVLDPATFSLDRLRYCFPNWYSWSEIVPGMLLQSLNQQKEEETEAFGSPIWKRFAEQQHRQLKFGPRISSVVWNRPNWVATPRDVHWVRCSPFDISLFAMKRHVFDESNPFFRKIRDLQRSDDMIDTIRGVRRISDECYRSVPLTIGF